MGGGKESVTDFTNREGGGLGDAHRDSVDARAIGARPLGSEADPERVSPRQVRGIETRPAARWSSVHPMRAEPGIPSVALSESPQLYLIFHEKDRLAAFGLITSTDLSGVWTDRGCH